MNIISYAQNFEDVMLWRALKHVENGFYLDVGAQDPVVDSVSLAFYEHGWRGCHVEPTSQYSEKLRQARPDESVLQLAIGKEEGVLSFFEFANTGLSTTSLEIANIHSGKGFLCRETAVPVISLNALLQRFGNRDIHWMKIDVEGGERAVLEGWMDSTVRPWILVIESTQPLTQEENYDGWEPLVLSKGYEFAYFDGLNRFYVSDAHPELMSTFSSPPNIFDGFVLSGTASQPFYKHIEARAYEQEQRALVAETSVQAEVRRADAAASQVQQAEAMARQLELRLAVAEAATHQWWQQANGWHERVLAIQSSNSWKITKPLRVFMCMARGDFSPLRRLAAMVNLKARQALRLIVAAGIRLVIYWPQLRFRLSAYVKRYPWLYQRLIRVAINMGVADGSATFAVQREASVARRFDGVLNVNPRILTPRAQKIYTELKAAIEKSKEVL